MNYLIAKFIRILGYLLLNFPAYYVKVFLGMPNTRIVYKNGHVEDYFFNTWNYTKNGRKTELTWDNGGPKTPKIIAVGEIESICTLY